VAHPRTLPVVLSRDEVARLLNATTCLKHQAALSVAYGAGLRVAEVAALKVADIDSERMLIRVERGKGGRYRNAMLPADLLTLLREWWKVGHQQGVMHRDGWLFPGQHAMKPISTRQLHRIVVDAAQAAEMSGSDRTHCGTALPPICWKTGSTSASSRFCSERRHTAHKHLIEGRIYYRFHPRCGETVLIKRELEYHGVRLVVILQPDSSLACIPAWMTHESAAQFVLSEKPHFSVDILRSMRAEIDAVLGFLQPESKAEEADNVVPIQGSPANPVRGERGARCRVGDRTDGRPGNVGGSSSARDCDSAGKRGGQQ
jgi:hypothetical protein